MILCEMELADAINVVVWLLWYDNNWLLIKL